MEEGCANDGEHTDVALIKLSMVQIIHFHVMSKFWSCSGWSSLCSSENILVQEALPDDLTVSVVCFSSSREAASKLEGIVLCNIAPVGNLCGTLLYCFHKSKDCNIMMISIMYRSVLH